MKLKIPNILTIGRIIIVPIFVVTFFIPGFFGDLIPINISNQKKGFYLRSGLFTRCLTLHLENLKT